MKSAEYKQRLDDERFVLGFFRKRSALKELANSSDPEAAAVLADAIDRQSPSSDGAMDVLKNRNDWTDKLWEIWLNKRQDWLGQLLQKRSAPHSRINGPVGAASRLKLGQAGVPYDASGMEQVAGFWHDKDSQLKAGARKYAESLSKQDKTLYLGMMLGLGEYETIGADRSAAESVVPFLNSSNSKIKNAAAKFCNEWLKPPMRTLSFLLNGREEELPKRRNRHF
jgi:hypothetical protein